MTGANVVAFALRPLAALGCARGAEGPLARGTVSAGYSASPHSSCARRPTDAGVRHGAQRADAVGPFRGEGGSLYMVLHDTGPVRDNVALVTDEAVEVAHRRPYQRSPRSGSVEAYCAPENIANLSTLLDRRLKLKESPMPQADLSMEAQ